MLLSLHLTLLSLICGEKPTGSSSAINNIKLDAVEIGLDESFASQYDTEKRHHVTPYQFVLRSHVVLLTIDESNVLLAWVYSAYAYTWSYILIGA